MAYFSIIVPIYNVEKYVEECIVSVLKQSFDDFELVIVDDGSKDSSYDIAKKYAEMDIRIKVFHKENEGVYLTRLYGLYRSYGKYVLFLDGDDYVGPNWLEEIYKITIKEDVDFVAFGFKRVDSEGNLLSVNYNDIMEGKYFEHDFESLFSSFVYDTKKRNFNLGNLFYSICLKAVKRNILLDCCTRAPYIHCNGEDLALTVSALFHSNSAYVLNNSDYFYRRNSTSLINTFTYNEIACQKVLFDHLYSFVPKLPRKNVDCFVFCRLVEHFSCAAKQFDRYDLFRYYVKTVFANVDRAIISEYDVSKLRVKDRIKALLLKREAFLVMWLLYRRDYIGEHHENKKDAD